MSGRGHLELNRVGIVGATEPKHVNLHTKMDRNPRAGVYARRGLCQRLRDVG